MNNSNSLMEFYSKRITLISVYLFLISIRNCDAGLKNIQFICQQRCNATLLSVPLPTVETSWPPHIFTQSSCDFGCHVANCREGCSRWSPEDIDKTLSNESCNCPDEGSCFQGCVKTPHLVGYVLKSLVDSAVRETMETNDGLGVKLIWQLDNVDAKILFGDQLLAISSKIKWEVQGREKTNAGTRPAWVIRKVFSPLVFHVKVEVEDLKPDTDYEFRLVFALGQLVWTSKLFPHKTGVSLAWRSVDSPKITKSIQSAPNQYIICWEKPSYFQVFKTYLVEYEVVGDPSTKKSVDVASECVDFSNLPLNSQIAVRVSENPKTGPGPPAVFSFSTPASAGSIPQLNPDGTTLYAANASVVVEIDRIIDGNTRIVFPINQSSFSSTDKITAVVAGPSRKVYVGTRNGNLYRVANGVSNSRGGNAPIVDLKLDWQLQRLYILRTGQISYCDFNFCVDEVSWLSIPVAKSIELDVWNGYLYMLSKNGVVDRTPLPSGLDPPTSQPWDRVQFYDLATAIALDYSTASLVMATPSQTLQSLSLVSNRVQNHDLNRDGTGQIVSHGNGVKKMGFNQGLLRWIKPDCNQDPCLFLQGESSRQYHNPYTLSIPVSGLVDFSVAVAPFVPSTLLPPKELSFLTGDKGGRLRWNGNEKLPFQSDKEWRLLTHSILVEEIHENGNNALVLNELDIKQTEISLPYEKPNVAPLPLTSNHTYTAKVRTCILGTTICSAEEAQINGITYEQPATFTLVDSRGNVFNIDTLGTQAVPVADTTRLIQQEMRRAPDEEILCVGRDSYAGNAYICQDRGISRVSENREKELFIDKRSVRWLGVYSEKALLIVAEPYSIQGYRMTGTYQQQFYKCNPLNEDCLEIVAFTLDPREPRFLYLGQNEKTGNVELYSLDYAKPSLEFIAKRASFPMVKSFQKVRNHFIFITEDEKIGVTDEKLRDISWFPPLPDIAHPSMILAPLQESATSHRIPAIISSELVPGASGSLSLEWRHERPVSQSLLYTVNITSIPSDSIIGVSLFSKTYLGTARPMQLPLSVTGNLLISIRAANAWDTVYHIREVLAPLPPVENLQIYFTHIKTPDRVLVRSHLNWDLTLLPNSANSNRGSMAQCWVGNRMSLNKTWISPSDLPIEIGNFRRGENIRCSVAALRGAGEPGMRTEIRGSTTEIRPMVHLLFATNEGLTKKLEDSTTVRRLAIGRAKCIAYIGEYAFYAQTGGRRDSIYWIHLKTFLRSVEVKTDLLIPFEIKAMTSDWVGHRLLVAIGNLEGSQQGATSIYSVQLPDDLSQLDRKSILEAQLLQHALFNLAQMTFDPFEDTIYFTNGSVMATKKGLVYDPFESSSASEYNCPQHQAWPNGIVSNFSVGVVRSPRLIATSEPEFAIEQLDPKTKTCQTLIRADALRRVNRLIQRDARGLSASYRNIYVRTTHGTYQADVFTKEVNKMDLPPILDILAMSPQFQPMPDITCLKITNGPKKFETKIGGRNSIKIQITDRPRIGAGCENLSLPAVEYSALVKPTNVKHCNSPTLCKSLTSFTPNITVNDLTSDHGRYSVRVQWTNRFSNWSEYSMNKNLDLGSLYPAAPGNVMAEIVTPTSVMLFWDLPASYTEDASLLRFQILEKDGKDVTKRSFVKWDINSTSTRNKRDAENFGICTRNPCMAIVEKLNPSSDYRFQVGVANAALQRDSQAWTYAGSTRNLRTHHLSGSLTVPKGSINGTSALLLWTPFNDDGDSPTVTLQYQEHGDEKWTSLKNFDGREEMPLIIDELRPASSYAYRYIAEYHYEILRGGRIFSGTEKMIPEKQNVFRTLSVPPSEPRNVRLTNENGWLLQWNPPANDGGTEIREYSVQFRTSNEGNWFGAVKRVPATNSEELSWNPAQKYPNVTDSWEFRVSAMNKDSMVGPPASSSDFVTASEGASGNAGIIIGLLALFIIVAIIIAVIAFIMIRARKPKPYAPPVLYDRGRGSATMGPPGDSHLESLKQIPPEELKALPHVPRSCITIARMLGKGAFGEVYEGLACNLPRVGPKSQRVAIKTLRQTATDAERVKFLKEAIMMGNFDHPNIVKLLGVCLDAEPHWIILELMEGGDLLSYLRASRPNDSMPSQVSLKDLIDISIDVAKGCAYLEDHHHVHRDLAARNCLISTRNPALRVVKIADFGLTRDIYTDDYYRVEGQGLLPIRWMAPESMIDGVFTPKTDVWSVGVLFWEVMTLGHQPYTGRTNWDVLNYVRIGGRLQKPEYCPDEMYDIMCECWGFQAGDRPTFSEIQGKLEKMKEIPVFRSDDPFPPSLLLSSPDGGYPNPGFLSSPETETTAGSGGTVEISAAASNAKFRRNHSNTASLKPRSSSRKKFGFRSLRRQKPKLPPAPPPSKDQLSVSIDGRTPTSSRASSSYGPIRPISGISGISSGAESFTTQRSDYEVPLVKGLTNTARNQLYEQRIKKTPSTSRRNHQGQGRDNQAYSSGTEDDYSIADAMPRSTISGYGPPSTPSEPGSPRSQPPPTPVLTTFREGSDNHLYALDTRYAPNPSRLFAGDPNSSSSGLSSASVTPRATPSATPTASPRLNRGAVQQDMPKKQAPLPPDYRSPYNNPDSRHRSAYREQDPVYSSPRGLPDSGQGYGSSSNSSTYPSAAQLEDVNVRLPGRRDNFAFSNDSEGSQAYLISGANRFSTASSVPDHPPDFKSFKQTNV